MRNVGEIEVETAWVRKQRQRRAARFLKGPIKLDLLHRAAQLPGKALALFLAIRHRADLRCSAKVTLPTNYLALWGVGRDAKRRALGALEGAGLIRIVDSRPGHSTVVASIDSPNITKEAEGPSQRRNERKELTNGNPRRRTGRGAPRPGPSRSKE